jgi:hypothetical protein
MKKVKKYKDLGNPFFDAEDLKSVINITKEDGLTFRRFMEIIQGAVADSCIGDKNLDDIFISGEFSHFKLYGVIFEDEEETEEREKILNQIKELMTNNNISQRELLQKLRS